MGYRVIRIVSRHKKNQNKCFEVSETLSAFPDDRGKFHWKFGMPGYRLRYPVALQQPCLPQNGSWDARVRTGPRYIYAGLLAYGISALISARVSRRLVT